MLNGPVLAVFLIVCAYLLGTFPTAQLVARASGRNVMQEGSGNPGASNVGRLVGWKAGAIVLFGDFAKGAIAAGVGLAVGGRPYAFAFGIAAVLGHMFPVTRKFHGGKGVATTGGMLTVLFPPLAVAFVLVWILIAKIGHLASIASLAIAVSFPIFVAILGYPMWEVGVLSALAVLVIVRHLPNLRRLSAGTELRSNESSGGDE